MSDTDSIKTEARLRAIELSVCQAHALLQAALKIPDAVIQQADKRNREVLTRNAIPSLPPELSDHYASELHDAIVRLQVLTQELRDAGRQTLSGSS